MSDAPAAAEGKGATPEDPSGPAALQMDAKLGVDVFKLDKEPHIVVDHELCRARCRKKVCLTVCPADLYELNDQGDVLVNWEGCLECGTCLICCDDRALKWVYPPGASGVQYRMS